MKTSKFFLLPIALVTACVLASGCSAIDPKVGPVQDASTCGAAPATTSVYGGSTAPSDAGSCVTPDPRCQPDAGYEHGECDRCEDTYCCTTRFDCYDNPGCFIADSTLDSCLDAVANDAGDKALPDAGTDCWNTFVSRGPIEVIRYNCQRQYCQDACEIP